MFEVLSDKLGLVFGRLSSKGKLTHKDVDRALREVRLAFLEADVNFRVTRDLVDRIRRRATGVEVLESLTPGQQVVKITNDELTSILGGKSCNLTAGSRSPSVVLLIGLNGSGKTTTAAKLAKHLKSLGQPPVLVAADLKRPAAVQQLETLGRQSDLEVHTGDISKSVLEVARGGVECASRLGSPWAIIDTAGRFQIDDELMNELDEIKSVLFPDEVLLVVDSMTGQDAVSVAQEFHERFGLTGLVLTKLDGDARGGAALSISAVTGVPIKFVGTGERVDDLEKFHPDRLASRILGMGDTLTLIEKAEAAFNKEQASSLERKMRQETFNLEDFLEQLQQLRKMGPMGQVLEMMPGMSSLRGKISENDVGEGQVKKVEAIIYSMTFGERRRPEIIGGSRKRRIARGSGTTPQDINQLLNQFHQMKKMMRQIASGKGLRDMARMIR